MELNLSHTPPSHGSDAGAIGYSRYGVQLHRALLEAGVKVFDQPTPDTPGEITNTVCWVSVPSHAQGWWGHQYTIMSTMWETMFLPPGFRDNLHHFDAVVVPCEQNRELFSTYHPNVHKIRLGIDPGVWDYVPRNPDSMFFTFLCGGSGARKGVDLAVQAFKKVFGGHKPGSGRIPRLVLKNPKGEAEVNGIDLYGPGIEMVSGRLTDQEEVGLYATADCYLQPSRGEGFGLQPLQAMAQGCPTILTDASGQAEFANLAYPIGAGPERAAYFLYGEAGDWWAPNLYELCDQMERVYDDPEVAYKTAEVTSRHVRSEFTWARTAQEFRRVFADQLSAPRQAPHAWYVPELRRYLVRVNRHITANVSGTAYRFEPGRDYYEVADIKRLMFEAGALEPSCFDVAAGSEIDTGLTVEQAGKIPEYSASMAWCPTCLQQLGSRPTRGDVMYDEAT